MCDNDLGSNVRQIAEFFFFKKIHVNVIIIIIIMVIFKCYFSGELIALS